nr:MAG TPA: hypothetical protein [Microviridae sp.]
MIFILQFFIKFIRFIILFWTFFHISFFSFKFFRRYSVV